MNDRQDTETQRYRLPAEGTLAESVLLECGREWATSAELGECVGMESSQAGGTASDLHRRGFLEREMVRGKCRYRLTDLGEQVIDEILERNGDYAEVEND